MQRPWGGDEHSTVQGQKVRGEGAGEEKGPWEERTSEGRKGPD